MKCLNEFIIYFFHFLCCVDIADKRRLGKETVTGSLRRERQEANPIPKRGWGRRKDGERTSQTGTSQVVHPSQDQYYVI